MKTMLSAVALAAAAVQPAAAITFPTFTTIYVAPGVFDDGSSANTGTATVVSCSNVSGVATTIRVLILDGAGSVAGDETFVLAHGESDRIATHATFLGGELSLDTGEVSDGVINIESLQSAVFCSFTVVPAAGPAAGFPLNAIRVNPHPGTVE